MLPLYPNSTRLGQKIKTWFFDRMGSQYNKIYSVIMKVAILSIKYHFWTCLGDLVRYVGKGTKLKAVICSLWDHKIGTQCTPRGAKIFPNTPGHPIRSITTQNEWKNQYFHKKWLLDRHSVLKLCCVQWYTFTIPYDFAQQPQRSLV